MEEWDVIVVGAGAAGLVAARRAAECGRRTLLIEKNSKPGAKILMSGGTRCNITQNTDERGIVEAFGMQGRFLHSALAALGPADIVTMFEDAGVPTKIESTGKIFPKSDRASDVLAALRRLLRESGAELALREPLRSIEVQGTGFELKTSQRTARAEKVIICCGGRSYPGCGTTGDGYTWLEGLGHTITPTRPALTPVTSDSAWVKSLQGVTLSDVNVEVVDSQKVIAKYRGGFLFTHFGLSGPAPMNVSGAIAAHPRPTKLQLRCDFVPDEPQQKLTETLQTTCRQEGKRQLLSLLPADLPRRLSDWLIESCELSPQAKLGELSKKDLNRLVLALKQTTIPVNGTRGFKKAEVTAGGVELKEVDSRTMESKIVSNLFLAGEILDLDGPIGGYNFQAAFSTGWLAGSSV